MHIIFTPQRRDDSLSVSKQGDVLTINGDAFDFSTIPDGGEIPEVPSELIIGPVSRTSDQIQITLIRPYGATASEADISPAPLENAQDGIIINYDGTSHVDA